MTIINSMKKAVIDIGSNSVRLMLAERGFSGRKSIAVTRLSEGLSAIGRLSPAATERTVNAVKAFAAQAGEWGAEITYVFATEAVRSASNGKDFCIALESQTGLTAHVLTGEQEALSAFAGVSGLFPEETAGVIDIGGASTELTVGAGDDVSFCKSIGIGAVGLLERAGRDRAELEKIIASKLGELGEVPPFGRFAAVSGTATALAQFDLGLREYSPSLTHMHTLSASRLGALTDKLFSLTVEEIAALGTIHPSRADVIAGGALLLQRAAERLGRAEVTVSEWDNLEGYLLLKETGRL